MTHWLPRRNSVDLTPYGGTTGHRCNGAPALEVWKCGQPYAEAHWPDAGGNVVYGSTMPCERQPLSIISGP